VDALKSPPPVTDDDQADRFPDSKPSAKIKSFGVAVAVDVAASVGVLVAVGV
jgi:hypothetical protein